MLSWSCKRNGYNAYLRASQFNLPCPGFFTYMNNSITYKLL